ncbi:hypothetical protein EfmAA96_07960 [Enterococcus faecium]|nr:hypothetical protein EfmAA96_07960 [Enterococcus faecium]
MRKIFNERICTSISRKLAEKYEDKGFISPSLIQRAVFQPLSNKQSIVAVSPTGSGKTLAYLWPLLLNVEPGEAKSITQILSIEFRKKLLNLFTNIKERNEKYEHTANF